MPEFKFEPAKNIIICHAEIIGRKGRICLKMAFDTGASYTMIPVEAAVAVGYEPLRSKRKIEIITGSGIEYVSVIVVPKFKAFGVEIRNMEVVCHNLPSQSAVEGLLGLNFITQAGLIIDFSKNLIIS